MRTLASLYHPITGTPFQADETYREVAPCPALQPYIRCFWGSEHPLPARPHDGGLVIPDTCMDIMFTVDYARNRFSAALPPWMSRATARLPAPNPAGFPLPLPFGFTPGRPRSLRRTSSTAAPTQSTR